MKNYNSLHLKSKLTGFKVGYTISVEILQNGNFVVVYHESSSNIVSMLILDPQGKMITQIDSIVNNNNLPFYYGVSTYDIKVLTNKETIFVYFLCNNQGSNIYSFDTNLYNQNTCINLAYAFDIL